MTTTTTTTTTPRADLPTSWRQLTVGYSPPRFVDAPLTRTDVVRYQGASGDLNPVHHDQEFAVSAGFPSVFSIGMLQAGILATYLTDWLGAANVRRLAVQFHEQVWPGDVLTYSATVVGLREEFGDHVVDLEAAATRQTGGVHLRGEATFVVPAFRPDD